MLPFEQVRTEEGRMSGITHIILGMGEGEVLCIFLFGLIESKSLVDRDFGSICTDILLISSPMKCKILESCEGHAQPILFKKW